jgi:hypothetical protein
MAVRHAIVTALVLGASLVPSTRAWAADPCDLVATNCPGATGTVFTHADGYRYSFDGRVLRRVGVSRERESEGDGRVVEYLFTPACWANQSGGGPSDADVGCAAANSAPQCAPDELLFRRYSREVAPDPQPSWGQPVVLCRGGVQAWSVPELSGLIAPEFRRALVEQPVVSLNPSPRGLVHLPVIASVVPLQPVGFTVTSPVPGQVTGTPSYRWDFGDGARFAGAGRAFDGTLPSQHPDYYVAHAYPSRGTKTVTLTVRWQGVFTVAGIQIPLEPIELSYPNPIEIVEARSQLVAGNT